MFQPPEYRAHQEWLGYVQPVGLVVSIPALLQAQAYVNKNIAPQHQQFLALLPRDRQDSAVPEIPDFASFTRQVFGWEASDLVAAPESLHLYLEAYDEVLSPNFVVKEIDAKDDAKPWLMLVKCYPPGTDLDANEASQPQHWQASPQARMEHLLLKTGVSIGLLFNHTQVRLVYKPAGENSGHATFAAKDMAGVSGRPIFAALHMLLSAERVFGFGIEPKHRLANILAESRKYQNVVSTKLAEQVLAALYELVRGFQAANAQAKGTILDEVLARDPQQVYAGLLTTLLRLVFILFAEDRDLLSTDPLYAKFYSLTELFRRLREDAGRHTDTMEQRYGAWAQLLVLFRMIHDGARHGNFHIPAREGYLFDPNRYPFLEGRPSKSTRQAGETLAVPHVSDGVVYRVLQNLLVLDGERLSYRSLDVEHIGGVYETMMGFNLEVAGGRSIAIKPTKSHGAPATVNLDELIAQKPGDRGKWLKEQSDQSLTGQAAEMLKTAKTIEDTVAALEKKIARHATPNLVPPGAMVLQPSDERRRSGSHYTPRSLTEPIVRTTLRPILERLGQAGIPTPDQLLNLKVCDATMGSGAFLVEACRQLAEELVESWHAHTCVPAIPPDEDELKHAQRIVAQRCLYGVDKNPQAVDLAKLSLWLATLAKDHPFTFLDHNLKAGDSLVGLSKEQIIRFHWKAGQPNNVRGAYIQQQIERATAARQQILSAREDTPYASQRQALAVAEEALQGIRDIGDLTIAAFFGAERDKDREKLRQGHLQLLDRAWGPKGRTEDIAVWQVHVHALRRGKWPLSPFHWEIEFPEVFGHKDGGFDVIVGNPPFLGGRSISTHFGDNFLAWLLEIQQQTTGGADLVSHFFRRAYEFLRGTGAFGLIATNTISQGDTRSSGLSWICTSGGTIFVAHRRLKWPGQAAVVVSVIHVSKGPVPTPYQLDGEPVERITSYLFHTGGHDDPAKLTANAGKSFQGSITYGMGFTFDDHDKKGVANPISLMHELITKDKRNAERIFPYLGGDEVNNDPLHQHSRYVIYFGDMTESEAMKWPDLMDILAKKVRPDRLSKAPEVGAWPWWQFWRIRAELYQAIKGLDRVLLTNAQASPHHCMAFSTPHAVFANSLNVFPIDSYGGFAILQGNVHEAWTRFFCSTLEDRLRYNPTDCFDTFPFPNNFDSDTKLEQSGKEYYDFRAATMVTNSEGLTKTYNRFHDPDETSPDIVRLRELHSAMDRAVLQAYGWFDLAERTTCEFLLDYEENDEEDESPSTDKRGKKKPWRYRWPDDFRDEVLARLLELNKQRAEEEAMRPVEAEKKAKRKKAAKELF